MAYIAVDEHGTHLFRNKPTRHFGENSDWWTDNQAKTWIHVPEGTAKIFNDNGLLAPNPIPFDKRDMNWGDNPIKVCKQV